MEAAERETAAGKGGIERGHAERQGLLLQPAAARRPLEPGTQLSQRNGRIGAHVCSYFVLTRARVKAHAFGLEPFGFPTRAPALTGSPSAERGRPEP